MNNNEYTNLKKKKLLNYILIIGALIIFIIIIIVIIIVTTGKKDNSENIPTNPSEPSWDNLIPAPSEEEMRELMQNSYNRNSRYIIE